MKISTAWLMAVALLAAPAFADKKLDDAIAKAEKQVKEGHPEEGQKTMEKAAAQGGAEGQIALARFHLSQGKIDEAAAALTKAVETATGAQKAEALATLSSVDLLHLPARDAVKRAQDAVTAQETPVSLAALARAQARASLGGQAAADKAVASGATVAVAHEALGEVHLASGRNNEAVTELKKALELDPKLNRARATLAFALVAAGKATEAVAEAKKATEAEPQLGEAFAAQGAAIFAENKDKWGEAIGQAQQGKFVNPQNCTVLLTVGKLFESQNLDQAVAAYRDCVKIDAGNVAARRSLILVQIRKGDYDAALGDAQKLAAEAPDSGEAQFLVGRLLARKGDWAEATKALEKATTLTPSLGDAWVVLGQSYNAQKKGPEAVKAFGKAVELTPDNVDFRTSYGLLLAINGQHDAAVTELKKVVGTPGYKDADGYINLGWTLRNMKKTDEALAAYRKAVELEPKNDQAIFGLARTLFNAQKFDEAIVAYQKVIEVEPKLTPDALDGIAWCYLFKKDLPHARETYEQAKTAGRSDANLADRIGKAEKGQAASLAEANLPDAPPEPVVVRLGPSELGQQLLTAGSANARCKAASDLVKFGAQGLQPLTSALKDREYMAVRSCAAQALGAIGPAAKAAVPLLTKALEDTAPTCAQCTPEQTKAQELQDALRRVIQAALQKIGR